MKWRKQKLSEITQSLNTKRIPLNSLQRTKKRGKGRYAYLGANNIVDWIDEYIFDEKILCVAEDGGSWGRNEKCSYIYEKKCWVNNHTHVLKENGKSNLEFLKYYLNNTDLSKYITGTTRGKLTKAALGRIKVPLPPLPIQKQITEILDTADALRQTIQEQLEELDQLAQSVFLDMFGDPIKNDKCWDKKSIGDSIKFMTSGSRGWAKYYSKSGDIFLRINNVGKNILKLNNLVYVQAPETTEAKRTKVEEGDVLISITADLGRTAVIPSGFPKAHINQHLGLLRFNENINPVFISEFISSQGGKSQIQKFDKGGVKAGLNFNDIKSINLIVPPLFLQNQFEEVYNNIELQKQELKASLKESEDLFNGLLQEIFN